MGSSWRRCAGRLDPPDISAWAVLRSRRSEDDLLHQRACSITAMCALRLHVVTGESACADHPGARRLHAPDLVVRCRASPSAATAAWPTLSSTDGLARRTNSCARSKAWSSSARTVALSVPPPYGAAMDPGAGHGQSYSDALCRGLAALAEADETALRLLRARVPSARGRPDRPAISPWCSARRPTAKPLYRAALGEPAAASPSGFVLERLVPSRPTAHHRRGAYLYATPADGAVELTELHGTEYPKQRNPY